MIAGAIAGARASVTGSFYELGPSFVPPFATAAKAGARVQLVLDRQPLGNEAASRMLLADGIDVRLASLPNAYMHWKAAVLDGNDLLLGSGNLIETDAPQHAIEKSLVMRGTREWWVHVRDVADLAAPLVERIDAAWTGAPALLTTVEAETEAIEHGAVGSPHPQVPSLDLDVDRDSLQLALGGSGVHTQTLDAIAQPMRRILVTVPYIFAAGGRVLELLETMEPNKALVQILLGEQPHPSDLHALKHSGFEVRVMNVARCTRGHAKGVIVDDTVIVSSANWSEPGMSTNDEASLRIVDPAAAAYFAAAFTRDWSAADPT